jgi:hypothetical protein
MLFETGIELAREQLEADDQDLFPFGLSVEVDQDEDDDEINLHEASSEEGEINSEDALDGLLEMFGENRDEFRAVAIVFDAELDEEWDAITVLVAHASGETVDVQLPYRISGRKRVYGELEESEGSLEVWEPSS